MDEYTLPNRNGLQQKNHLIRVSGEGEMAIQPDSATVNLGVITENKELIISQQQNSHEVTKVINSLVELGIPRNQLQTFDYRIESNYDFEQGKQIFRGYKITHILQVKIDDLSRIGNIVDFAVQNGVNYVSNVQFIVKNKEPLYQQALILALNNARDKARTIAGTLRVTLLPTPNVIIEGGDTTQPFINQSGTFVKATSSTQFEPGQLVVKARISADFHYN
ncbi:MAG: SIMPL domain-containing protein [Bacillus sp. (in: Bacteria)]|nr:SIMPL domain-containing protein [Bacillus sp. (in: firmicutes)]